MGNEEVSEEVMCSLCGKKNSEYMQDFLLDDFFVCKDCMKDEAGEE